MKQTLPVVHCIYTEAEKSLAELLEESFRLILSASLRHLRNPLYNVCDEWSLISRRKLCT